MNYKEPGLSSLLTGMVDLQLTSVGFYKDDTSAIKVVSTTDEGMADYMAYRTIWIRMANLFVQSILGRLELSHVYSSDKEMMERHDSLMTDFHPNGQSWLVTGKMSVWWEEHFKNLHNNKYVNQIRTCPDVRIQDKTIAIVGAGPIPASYHVWANLDECPLSVAQVQKYELASIKRKAHAGKNDQQ